MAWSGNRFGSGRSGTPFNRSPSTELKQKLGLHSRIFSNVRKLVTCSECGISHHACSPCKYVMAAQSKCLRLGVDPSDFKLHLDLDLIETDNLVYLAEEPTKSSSSPQRHTSHEIPQTRLHFVGSNRQILEPEPLVGIWPAPGTKDSPGTWPAPGTKDSPGTRPAPGTKDSPGTRPAPGTKHSPGPWPAPGTNDSPCTWPAPGTLPTTGTEDSPGTNDSPGTWPASGTKDSPSTWPAPGSKDSPVTQPEKSTQPAPATQPAPTNWHEPGTQPAPDTQPALDTQPATQHAPSTQHESGPQPTPATEPVPATQPAPANQSADGTKPAPDTLPSLGTRPAPGTQPAPATQPAPGTKHESDTQPVPVIKPAPDIQPPPTIQPALPTPPAVQPFPSTQPLPGTQSGTQPAPVIQPALVIQPAPATQPAPAIQPAPANQPAPLPAVEQLSRWDRENVQEQELMDNSPYWSQLNKHRIILRDNLRMADVWPHLHQMTVITQNDEERMRLNATNCDSVDRLIAFINTCETWAYHALLRAMALTNQGHLIPPGGLSSAVYMQDIPPAGSTVMGATTTATDFPAQKAHFYRKVDSNVTIPISADLLPGLLRHCEVSERILMKADLFGFHDDITIDLTQFQICIDVKCKHKEEEKAIKSKELFNRLFQRHGPNTLLVEGEAGSGKSTYLQDYAHRHCKEFIECEEKGLESACPGHSWKLILYIPAGSVIGSQEAAIGDNLHCDEKHKDQLMAMIRDDGEGVLVMNDGLDELRKHTERNSIRQYTIAHQKSGRPKILNSSRNGLCNIEGKYFDRSVTLDGFSLSQGLDYIRQYFKESSNADHAVLFKYIKKQKAKLEWILTNPLRAHIFSELTMVGRLTQEDIETLTLPKLMKVLQSYVLRRDEKCRDSDMTDTHSTDFYRLCLQTFLADERSFSEQSIAETSPYKAFLKKDNTITVFAREKRYNKFGHEVFFEYSSVQGLINFMKSNPPNKKALLLCLCTDCNMRNTLELLCGCISEYEPGLRADLLFIMQACLILQVEELQCEKNKLTRRLLQLRDLIKDNFTAKSVYKGVSQDQEKKAMDICEEIQAAFGSNSKSLRTAGWFFNLYKMDKPGNMLKWPTPHLLFLIRCLRQCSPTLRDQVCSQTTHPLLPCVGYNMMDHNLNGDSYVFAVSDRRWGAVRDHGIEGGFLRFMSIIVWCPSDVVPALRQVYQHRNPLQPADGTPFLSTNFYIDIDNAFDQWGDHPDVLWACEAWEGALCEVLKHTPASINIGNWSHRTVPLCGLFAAIRQVISLLHSMRGGIGVVYGQVSEEVLEEFCQWTQSVNLKVKLGKITVLLTADRDADYVTRLHARVQPMVDGENPPSYVNPSGQNIEYTITPLVDSAASERVRCRQTCHQLLEATGIKADDRSLVNTLLDLTYNTSSSEPSVALAELDMD